MERVETSLARTALWGALAEAFRRPDGEGSELLDELPGAARALGLDARDLLAAPRDLAGRRAAYDAIFGHVVRGPCPAYEGEYGEPKGHRFAHEIGDVTGFYSAFGLGPSRGHPERPDHISVECDLAGQEYAAHPPAAELPVEAEGVAQDRLEPGVERGRHQ